MRLLHNKYKDGTLKTLTSVVTMDHPEGTSQGTTDLDSVGHDVTEKTTTLEEEMTCEMTIAITIAMTRVMTLAIKLLREMRTILLQGTLRRDETMHD